MRFSFLRRSISFVCLFSLLCADVAGDLRICALRVSFQIDEDESTSGNGQFLLSTEGIDCGGYTIDPTPHNKSYFESQLKAVDAYFSDVSYEKFGIDLENSTVFPSGEDDLYTLPNSMSYYNPYDEDDIQEKRITTLFSDAVNQAYEIDQINFSSYDLVVVFHAGIGQDFALPFLDPTPEDIPSTYVDNDMIMDNLGISSISVGGHDIEHGIILPETQNHLLFDIADNMFSTASEPCEYQYGLTGTFALMIGFAVGLPPLWNIGTGESGVGIFGLMDQGSNNGRGVIPAPPTAWTRIYAGWETPTPSTSGTTYNLASRRENQIVKVDINESEYFLIENCDNTIHDGISLDSMRYAMYEASGSTTYPPLIEVLQDSINHVKDESGVIVSVPNYDIGLPASGLLIWHIDEDVINSGLDDFSVNSNLSRLGVDLEEADGAQDIGYKSIHIFNDPSAGYFGDVWFKGNTQYELANPSMGGMKPEFGPFTYPSTKANNGSSTFISISNISKTDSSMFFTVSNSLVRDGFPIEDGEIIDMFPVGDKIMSLGRNDTILWIAHIDTLINKVFFHPRTLPNQNLFAIISEQENYTLIDIHEWPSIIVNDDDSPPPSTYFTRYEFYHSTDLITELFSKQSSYELGAPILQDSVFYLDYYEWHSHSKRVFTSSFNYGIDLGSFGITASEFGGTIAKWDEISFRSISGIDLDLDANVDVLALDSTGSLYAFNSELLLISGFPMEIKLQSPVLARDLFGDAHPEIVAKSEDFSTIYIFDYKGNVQYQITSNKNDELVALKPIDGKNSIITRHAIYHFGEETDSKGNEWAYEHGNWGRSRRVELDYSIESEGENNHIRSYCYPNPIRDNTGTIRVETIGAEKVEINLYDLAGYFIKTWTEELIHGGNQITEWVLDVTDVESGVYFAHVAVSGENGTETNIVKIAVIH